MKRIYIDVLIVLNIYVNYFLIKGTSKLTHTHIKTFRCLLSSFFGSFFSLTILLPKQNMAISLGIKLAAAAIIVAIAFGIRDKKHTLKLVIYFYIVNFIFGGFVMLMYEIFKPSFMTVSNSFFYVDFSLVSLVIFTALAYAAVSVCRYFLDKGCDISHSYSVLIRYKDRVVSLDAIPDTGNSLVDIFTGKPVIVCGRGRLSEVDARLGENMNAEKMLSEGFRPIPYSTIGNEGIIPLFTPDEVIICDRDSGRKKSVDALIGVNLKETPAIFNPGIL